LAIAAGRALALWDPVRAVPIAGLDVGGPARAVAFVDDGALIAARDRLIWWTPQGAVAISVPIPVTAIAIDGPRVVLGFGDGRVAIVTRPALRALARPFASPEVRAPGRCPGDPRRE
ncbi:MAG: hypothetical protein K8W52_45025, partial [Deltaproteobacteria bacterium]|nr:hypothetical protein [Deltaproteobacteria bacterium]